jgi:hypothetical protein
MTDRDPFGKIKNVVKMAQSMAIQERQELELGGIKSVADALRNFSFPSGK